MLLNETNEKTFNVRRNPILLDSKHNNFFNKFNNIFFSNLYEKLDFRHYDSANNSVVKEVALIMLEKKI